MSLPWPTLTTAQWRERLAPDSRLLTLRREREAIYQDLFYVREEDLPGAAGRARVELERRKAELEARLARLDYEIEQRRLP